MRYKAWQPHSALHPTIGVDTPLVFDVVDQWNRRSIGGFTYFVSHPGGRSYDTFPINGYEAQSRRINRFWSFGHSQGMIQEVAAPIRAQHYEATAEHLKGRMIESRKAGDHFYYQELPTSKEYPHTLDMRRKRATHE